MSATTVNAFPPLHAFNSSRSWFVAIIVLVHLGFFWGLTHGVTIRDLTLPTPPLITKMLPYTPKPPPKPTPIDVQPVVTGIFVPPTVVRPQLPPDETHPPLQTTGEAVLPPPATQIDDGAGSGPLIIEPALDERFPFTEPEYPVSEIRQGHEGTVLLALQILPNGRVGAVRIDKSSGYLKLDESAAREARRWRMKPGTSDGAAMPMWKRVPIKFQLKN